MIARLFTTAARTLVITDAITIIRPAIVDTALVTSTADRTVVALILNQMLLFTCFGTSAQ